MAKKRGVWSAIDNFRLTSFILNNLAYLAFLGLLATIYIGNAHYAEYNVRRIQELEREVRDRRYMYLSVQSENMYNSLRSEVAESVEGDGLSLRRGEPKKISVRRP